MTITCRHCRNCRRSCSLRLRKEAGFARRRAMCRGCNFYFVFLFVFSIFCMLVFDFWYLVFAEGSLFRNEESDVSWLGFRILVFWFLGILVLRAMTSLLVLSGALDVPLRQNLSTGNFLRNHTKVSQKKSL